MKLNEDHVRLTGTRLTLVDSYERDGERYFVFRERRGSEALTPREREVLLRASRGATNKVIAYDLGLSWSTVRVLIFRAANKLGTRSRQDAIRRFSEIEPNTARSWTGLSRVPEAGVISPPRQLRDGGRFLRPTGTLGT